MSNKGLYGKFNQINAKTSEEAVAQCGADFEVEKVDMLIRPDGETEAVVPFHQAIMRKDTHDILGVMSRSYGIVQYATAVKATEALVEEGMAVYAFGRLLGKGEKFYLFMTDEQVLDLGIGSNGIPLLIQNHFSICSSHDGSLGFEISPTPVILNSGSIFTVNQSGRVWTKHSKKVDGRVETLKSRFHKVREFWAEFTDSARMMATAKVTNQQAEEFFLGLVDGDSTRAENIRAKLVSIYVGGPQRVYPAANGTVFGLLMATVEYADREKTVKISKKMDRESCEIRASLEGDAARLKAESYASALILMNKLGIK